MTPKQKEHWETLAKVEGLKLSQVTRMMVDDFLEKPNWITHNTWRFLKAAADIIDKEGHANRRRERIMNTGTAGPGILRG